MKTAKLSPDIDPFRERQVPDVAGRFERERDRARRQADLTWLGAMVAFFSDHELRLLDDLGFLSQHDRDLLRQAGRMVPVAQAGQLPGARRPGPQKSARQTVLVGKTGAPVTDDDEERPPWE